VHETRYINRRLYLFFINCPQPCLVVPAFICIDLLISLVLKINDDDDDDDSNISTFLAMS